MIKTMSVCLLTPEGHKARSHLIRLDTEQGLSATFTDSGDSGECGHGSVFFWHLGSYPWDDRVSTVVLDPSPCADSVILLHALSSSGQFTGIYLQTKKEICVSEGCFHGH